MPAKKEALPVFRFGQHENRADLGDRFGENRGRHDRRAAAGVRQVALVERHVLDADDPLVDLELDDAIDPEKRIAMAGSARSLPRSRAAATDPWRWPAPANSFVLHYSRHPVSDTPTTSTSLSTAPPHIREVVITLFELGREVTSVLDLDELLEKIPQLIARLIKFHAFAVYLLDAAREELQIAYSVGYPADCAQPLKLKVGEGLVGAAVAEGAPTW